LKAHAYEYSVGEVSVKESYSTFYVINIVFQSIFTLLWQIGVSVLLGWVFVSFVGAPEWIYVPLILLGVGSGLVSMVRFILTAMKSLERLEEERRAKKRSKDKQNGK
jgi:F0F1-type ATP synthase assembly protein I